MFHGCQMLVLDPRWSQAAAALGLGDYEAIINHRGPAISETSTTRVFRLNPEPAVWPGGVYLKQCFYGSWVRLFLRPAKPYLEMRNYRFLAGLGLNVPKVLAVGQRRKFGGVVDSFIITAGIENARSLEDCFRDKPDAAEMTDILDQLARTVSRMHQANFFHIDLQCRNVLVQRGTEGNRVFLIDCPRGGRRWFSPHRWNGRWHDLAGLEKLAGEHLAPRDRIKWFKRYAGVKKIGWQDRRLIRRIIWQIESRRHPEQDST